jgi:hypothetical protein
VSKFDKLVAKLVSRGHSEDSARRIAYTIGVAKYGRRGMARKAAAARVRKARR